MTRRRSVQIDGFNHSNPIPSACRIGNLLFSGVIVGRDPYTGQLPPSLEEQCANVFAHMRAIVEAAGGSTEDIIKVMVWLQDLAQRGPLNVEWLKMFPDPDSSPARHTLQLDVEGGPLVRCDFIAVIDG